MPAKNAKVSHKGAGGGSSAIPARGAGNKSGAVRNVSQPMKSQSRLGKAPGTSGASKGTTGGKASTVKGSSTRGGKGTQGKR